MMSGASPAHAFLLPSPFASSFAVHPGKKLSPGTQVLVGAAVPGRRDVYISPIRGELAPYTRLAKKGFYGMLVAYSAKTQNEADDEKALAAAHALGGWREGEEYLFSFGALLSESVFFRRGVDPIDGGRRHFVPCSAPGYALTFDLKGAWATVVPHSEAQGAEGAGRDVHGVLLP